jgi:transcriptional regulator with XRE-family HTH domain
MGRNKNKAYITNKIALLRETNEAEVLLMVGIGRFLRKRRKELGYTLRDIMALTGMDARAIMSIEYGAPLSTSFSIARYLCFLELEICAITNISSVTQTVSLSKFGAECLKSEERNASRIKKDNIVE